MSSACGNDQVVVRNLLFRRDHNTAVKIEISDLLHQNFYVRSPAQNPADRGRDFTWGESSSRHLIEERLKGVMILAVH